MSGRFAAAVSSPNIKSVAELRLDAVTNAWRICVTQNAANAASSPGGIEPSLAVEIAMRDCAEFERDFRAAMYPWGSEFLRKKGIETVGPDMVNDFAEETLKLMISEIRSDNLAKLKIRSPK